MGVKRMEDIAPLHFRYIHFHPHAGTAVGGFTGVRKNRDALRHKFVRTDLEKLFRGRRTARFVMLGDGETQMQFGVSQVELNPLVVRQAAEDRMYGRHRFGPRSV